jgi:bifunctional DNA-binding transcriptional regulator/antitoxin component of YhaV-PrlF toxin-antitoxin module
MMMPAETISIDTFGRVLIPKRLRKALKLEPQTQLEIQIHNGALLLSPRVVGQVVEQDGIFVWTGADVDGSIDELLQATRDERLNDLE